MNLDKNIVVDGRIRSFPNLTTSSATTPLYIKNTGSWTKIEPLCSDISTGVSDLDLSDDIKEKMFNEFMSKLSRVPTVKHECHSCGGTVEFNADKHIFICPYCGSCYAVGTAMINSTY